MLRGAVLLLERGDAAVERHQVRRRLVVDDDQIAGDTSAPNGEVLQVQKLDSQYFGEGIAVFGSTLFELTWQSGIGFLYDRASFQRKGTFTYPGEGWGLTHDGHRLIMSDGSAYLRFLDPATQKEISRLQVRDGGTPVVSQAR